MKMFPINKTAAIFACIVTLCFHTSYAGTVEPCYEWTASLDRTTGVATSKETSNLVCKSNKSAANIFKDYPNWLCSGRVTLGLFRAVPSPKNGVALKTRLLGTTMLEFGSPRVFGSRCELPITGGLLAARSQGYLYFGIKKKSNIETRIVGYVPSISGLPTVSRMRSWIYLNTQSLVHANVMCRFHGYVRNELSKGLITKAADDDQN